LAQVVSLLRSLFRPEPLGHGVLLHSPMMQTSTLVFATLLLAVLGEPPVQCNEDSPSGKTCLSTSGAQDVLAMDDVTVGADVNLLQVAAAREDKSLSNATQGQMKKDQDVSNSDAGVKEVAVTNTSSIGFAHASASSKEVSHTNTSSKDSCMAGVPQFTGGTCALTGSCDASRSAECKNGMCICPEYMCAKDGACFIDPQQVSQAVGSGVQNVGSTITDIARNIPGVADSMDGIMGAVSGVGNTVSGIVGSITGANDGPNTCSAYISTCFFSNCDSSLGFLASCEYGSCQCKPGFCASNGACQVDLNGLMQAGADAVSQFAR